MDSTPAEFSRRILLAVTGLSPQVVTETLYALAVVQDPPFVPTEVHLVTTAKGAEHARLTLLSEEPGWFHRLCRDYALDGIRFDTARIHTLHSVDGKPMDDIRTPADNERAADFITERIRQLTAEANSALHVSIAGGRKTMGFYAGYAMSLYGRPQDRLSHVLVSPPFESHPDFFYPTRQSRVIYSLDTAKQPLDTREARVTLAEIPFVRLRSGLLPTRLLKGQASFSQTVAAAQKALEPPELVIDLNGCRISACGEVVTFRPAELAFYSWMARRRRAARHFVRWNDADTAAEYLAEYGRITPEMSGDFERAEDALRNGMTQDYFDQRKSKTNGALQNALGEQLALRYLISSKGRRPETRFGLLLEPEAIRYQRVRVPAASHVVDD